MECAVWWKYFEDWGGMKYNATPPVTKVGGAEPWAAGLDEVFYMK